MTPEKRKEAVERVRLWRKLNPEKYREQSRRAREKNPQKAAERTLRWQLANPDRVKAYRKNYRKNNREKVLLMSRKSYLKHKKKRCAEHREYMNSHSDLRRANQNTRRTRLTKAGGAFTVSEWKVLCKKHGNRCLCCGKRRKLTADHVVPVSKGGSSNIENIQPLCKSCNSKKGTKTTDYRNTN
jgi:5-methylcytosine-specific restriction endonuclease McrA